jgi:flagella basal body P-ring formation protein FlgA
MPRKPPKFCRRGPLACVPAAALATPLLATLLPATILPPTAALAAPVATAAQDLNQLESLARSEAVRLLPPLTERQRLQVGPIPARLTLQRCADSVTSAAAPGLRAAGRVLIELRCDGSPAWHLYVPVRVVGTSPVAIAAHALIPGTVLTAKDISLEQRDMNQLPPGYLDDASIAVGLTAARGISGGAVLTNQLLLGSKAVQRGQSVTLIASSGGFSVRMAGRALSDGLINQRVRVQNLSSGKVVEGVARSEQLVEIIFQ